MTDLHAVEDQPRKLPTASPEEEARAQAEAYDSLFSNQELELDGGRKLSIPPHPDFGMLGDEETEAYEELLFERDTEYEREPDVIVPEQRLKDADGNETGVVVPGETIQGAVKRPYRRIGADGKPVLVKPSWSVRVVRAALGETKYKELTEGGRCAADVWRVWGKQGLEAKQRQGRPEADGSPVDLAAISTPDSQ